METIAERFKQDEQGDTTAKGGYKIYTEGSNVNIEVDVKVTKAGMSGSGKGMIGFEILNDSYEPVFKIAKGLSVGSRVPQGINHKTWSKSLEFTGPKATNIRNNGIVAALVIDATSDSDGIPTTPDEFRATIRDWASVVTELDALADGATKVAGKWEFLKIAFA